MTCRELRRGFEDPLGMDAEFPRKAEHLAHCSECARFVEARHPLGAGLRLVRESAPEPSAALEAAVLASYRAQITGGGPPALRSRKARFKVACSAAAAAAVLALALVLLLQPARRLETSNLKIKIKTKIESAQRPTALPVTAMKAANRVPSTNAASPPRTRPGSPRPPRRAAQLATTGSPAWEDFRGLMYCDPFSCGGAMQLIRVQLPSSAAAFEPAAGSTYGAIYADVLVGSDGIARGIRVVP